MRIYCKMNLLSFLPLTGHIFCCYGYNHITNQQRFTHKALLKSCPPSGPLLILAAAAAAADNRILQNDTAEIPEGKEGRKLILSFAE